MFSCLRGVSAFSETVRSRCLVQHCEFELSQKRVLCSGSKFEYSCSNRNSDFVSLSFDMQLLFVSSPVYEPQTRYHFLLRLSLLIPPGECEEQFSEEKDATPDEGQPFAFTATDWNVILGLQICMHPRRSIHPHRTMQCTHPGEAHVL